MRNISWIRIRKSILEPQKPQISCGRWELIALFHFQLKRLELCTDWERVDSSWECSSWTTFQGESQQTQWRLLSMELLTSLEDICQIFTYLHFMLSFSCTELSNEHHAGGCVILSKDLMNWFVLYTYILSLFLPFNKSWDSFILLPSCDILYNNFYLMIKMLLCLV